MSGNYPAGVTDNHPEFDMPSAEQGDDRDDAIDALQQAGMEPMDTAPRDREIIVVVEETLERKRVYFHADIFGDISWLLADDDSGTWPRWYSEELLGWMEVAP